jgi:photosynthesis system II assembly factor YCF48-like protein
LEQLPNIVRERLEKTPVPATHPDPDLLAAFSEQVLQGSERTQILEHLAMCADCRQIVALAPSHAEPAMAAAARPRKSGWLSLPALRWGTVAAFAVIVCVAVVLHEQRATAPVALKTATTSVSNNPAASATIAESKQPLAEENKPATQEERGRTGDRKATSQQPSGSRDKLERRSDQLVASSPAIPAPRSAVSAMLKKKADEISQLKEAQPPSASESVEVIAQANTGGVSESEDIPGKAKNPSPNADQAQSLIITGPAAKVASGPTVSQALRAGPAFSMTSRAVTSPGTPAAAPPSVPVARWTLSPEGVLERSFDAGKTWQIVTVADNAAFRAVSALGVEVWAGGAAGLLYHSSDAGQHWLLVKLSSKDRTLSADIASIQFTDPQHGKITTTTGEIWTTSDGGQTWQKQ